MSKKIFLIIYILLSIKIIAEDKIERTQVIMGTFATITVNKSNAKFIDDGFDNLRESEQILSSYDKNALVFRLNRDKKIYSNKILVNILEKSKFYYNLTNGYFDITIGSITKKLYHFGENERVASKDELKNAILNIDAIKIDDNNIFLDDNITIDLGGIGKGYAVDRLSNLYNKLDIKNYKIALSGDIRCFNRCNISIQNPFKEDALILKVKSKIKNLSISTSGTYRRYIKSKENHHLINPKTKLPAKAFVSITIIAQNNNRLCDAMATAISVMPLKKAIKFLESQNQFGYILIEHNGNIIKGNIERYLYFQAL